MFKQVKIRVIYDFNPSGKDHYFVEVRVFYFFTGTVCHNGSKKPIYFNHPNDVFAFKEEFYEVSEYMKQIVYQAIAKVLILIMSIILGWYLYESH